MKKYNYKVRRINRGQRTKARGQSMAVVGIFLALGVLIGLVAIAFDGGSALLQRRTMQNGAEAGALAGVDIMSHNMAVSCANDTSCYPTYLIKNQDLRAHIESFVSANRGGTVGNAAYTTIIEYHYLAGHLPPVAQCPAGPRRTLGYCPPPVNPVYEFVPNYVDGLAVTAQVNNPTTFARAIPRAIADVKVSAIAAARIKPTCPVATEPGDTLPFTRYRPAVEKELYDASGGNSVCHPFGFWRAQPDVGSSVKNVMSFNFDTLHPHDGITQQFITSFDTRAGVWPAGAGLRYFDRNNVQYVLDNPCTSEPCVNMYNAGVPPGGHPTTAPTFDDMANWIFWQWKGRLSFGNDNWNQIANSMTLYPSTRQNGANGTQPRTGDWVEVFDITGSGGENIQSAVYNVASRFGTATNLTPPVSQGGLNWGKAVARDIYVWGEPASDPRTGQVSGDNKSAQVWDSWYSTAPNPCASASGQPDLHAWTDLEISGTYPNSGPSYDTRNVSCNGGGNPRTVDRVRFTWKYNFLFYANLQGNNGAVAAPGCPALNLDPSGSTAYGILPSVVVPPPAPGGTCGPDWVPGGPVFSQQIDPNT